MEKQYYVFDGSEQRGPYPAGQIARWITEKVLEGNVYIWTEGYSHWKYLADAEEFAHLWKKETVAAAKNTASTSRNINSIMKSNKVKYALMAAGGLVLIIVAVFLIRHLFPPEEDLQAYITGVDMTRAEFGTLLEEALAGDRETREDDNWQEYPDREREQEAVDRTLDRFVTSLEENDLEAALGFISAEKQEAYRQVLTADSQAMEILAYYISRGEMSFLAAKPDQETTTVSRTAECRIDVDGYTFYITLIKEEGDWVLYDF